MRVGLAIDALDPARGGVEQWTVQFARQLAHWGHEVHVVARDFVPHADRFGIVPHQIDYASRQSFARAAEHKLRELALDVVHDLGVGWYGDVFQPHGGSRRASFEQNLRLLPSWKRPLKRSAARLLPRYRHGREMARRQYGVADRIYLALSQMVARDFVTYHDVDPQQIRLVYNGVDTRRFSPEHRTTHRDAMRQKLGVAPDETLLLIVAHNYRLKGVPTLVRAMGRLAAAGRRVRLVVAGGEPGYKQNAWAQRAGAAGKISFVGSVGDPVPLYAAADVYVQPTFYDPCSLVVLEALASGLPVVTTRFNGAGELLTEGVEGHVIDDPADDRTLSARLGSMLSEDVRGPMSIAARQLAEQHTLERNCREIVAVYQEIKAEHRLAA